MQPLNVSLGERSYPIHIGPGLLGKEALVGNSVPAAQVLLVTNDVVAPLYLSKVEETLAGREVHSLILADGEQEKSLGTLSKVMDRLVELGFRRDACLVALGGGVIGDVTGFAAACYQRGVDFVQMPTTLLAQVDSSVGGKTAVNHPAAKNMIGAFHQPLCVIADTDTLTTLPRRELSAGLAEVIKHGLILDRDFFLWLENHMEEVLALEPQALTHVVRRSCEIKAAIVAEDEREQGRRALLNLGHTFGHALEALTGYKQWLHGEAVAIGITLAARTSLALGMLESTDCGRIEALLTRARLPVIAPGVEPKALSRLMSRDKKARSAGLRMVLLESIGEAVLVPAPEESLLEDVIRTQSAA